MTRVGSVFSGVSLLALAMLAGPVLAMVDPTRPLGSGAAVITAGDAVRPSLDSVLIGPGRRVAVIDGRAISEGEARGGVRVWRITPQGAEVSVGDGPRLRLDLKPSGMHKEPR